MNIKTVLLGGFGYVYAYRNALAKALLFPVILLIVLELSLSYIASTPYKLFLSFFQFLPYTIIAITVHRIILIGEGSIPEWGYVVPNKRDFQFFLCTIGISLLFMIPGMLKLALFTLLSNSGIVFVSITATLIAAYMVSRFSLVFPAIATDKKIEFATSWKATKDYQLLMLVVVFVFPILLNVPSFILQDIPYTSVLTTILSIFAMIFGISTLSVAFQVIKAETIKATE